MKKLIDLLNQQMEEQEKTGPKLARFISYDGINKVFDLNNGCSFCVEFVLSKRYGFIKWLVENNKIDFENNKLQVLKDLITNGNQIYDFKVYSDYESLLMLLSIQDNPVKFLVSILK